MRPETPEPGAQHLGSPIERSASSVPQAAYTPIHPGSLGDTFSDNDKAVIRERHFGWEKASFSLLGKIFRVHPNTIAAICRQPFHNPSDNSSNASRGGEGVEPAEFRIAHKQSTTLGGR